MQTLAIFPIPYAPFWHLLLETIGLLLAYRCYDQQRAAARDPLSEGHRFAILLAAASGALLGSRLLGGLESPSLFLSGGGTLGWRYYLVSKTIVGGLLGGLLAVELARRHLGARQRSGDRFVFPLLIAMTIGRVGCFLMGVQEPTYGLPTQTWAGVDLGDGFRRHPTALYEIGWLAVTALVLHRYGRRWPNGWQFMGFMTAYLLYRFGVGFWQPGERITGLLSIQWACLLGLGWYAYEWWRESRPYWKFSS